MRGPEKPERIYSVAAPARYRGGRISRGFVQFLNRRGDERSPTDNLRGPRQLLRCPRRFLRYLRRFSSVQRTDLRSQTTLLRCRRGDLRLRRNDLRCPSKILPMWTAVLRYPTSHSSARSSARSSRVPRPPHRPHLQLLRPPGIVGRTSTLLGRVRGFIRIRSTTSWPRSSG